MILRGFHKMTASALLRVAVPLTLLVALLAMATPALGAETHAHWSLESRTAPKNLPPGGEGMIIVTAANLGDAPINGGASKSTAVITDRLPEGVKAISTEKSFNSVAVESVKRTREEGFTCPKSTGEEIECTYTGELPPYEILQLKIRVKDAATEGLGKNAVAIGGGEAPAASLEEPVTVSSEAARFGVESFGMAPETEAFQPDLQAGSHPYQLTTTFNLNQGYEPDELAAGKEFPTTPDGERALEKELSFRLPPGLIGNVNAVKQCSGAAFGSQGGEMTNACPNETVVGVASVTVYDPNAHGEYYVTYVVPVFNLEPGAGEPARFGFSILHVPVVLDTAVRTGDDYGVTINVHYAGQTVEVLGSKVTFWGIPGDPRHNASRGWACLYHIPKEARDEIEACGTPATPSSTAEPFLLLPTVCGTSSNKTTVEGETWNAAELKQSGEYSKLGEGGESLTTEFPTQGCSGLEFNPSISVEAESHEASTPTGSNVAVSLPQTSTMEPSYESNAEAAVSATRLELPVGVQTNPGAANGLGTCSSGGIGLEPSFEETAQLDNDHFTAAAASCPESAKIGTVTIKTPLLERELTGGVYLAEQDTNPFASPLVLYLIAEDKAPGEEGTSKVLVKLAGEVTINPTNGQLVSDFRNTPESPFETLSLHLWSGGRASEATPARCGAYSSKALFTNSSNEVAPEPESNGVQITSGAGGSACPGATLPFQPSFQAESANPQAAAFSPFTVRIQRPDGDAALKTISLQLPPGVAALLSSVPLCDEPQAAAGTCGEESKIGESVAYSGLGGTPVRLPGDVYLTGPYDGAPFGLSTVTHATKVGPFDVGTIVARSSINVNEFTAAATINTEAAQFFPSAPVAGEQTTFAGLPEMLKGVPAQVKELEVTVNRPNFEFNPTNCEPMSVTGTLTGYEGTSEGVSTPFKVGNCAALPFTPTLTASTAAQGSKPNGTSLDVTVESPGLGQAGLHKVDLTLPQALPSRLTTIQKACLEVVFNANPAGCEEGSVIGEGIVHTPVFKNPLKGPAYLVSHGNAAFPDVEFVLQGEGITLILDGKTDIKKGITYSKFETSPDAPFTKFESIFPAGPHSALTVETKISPTYNLCKQSLTMPTEITGQNGAYKKLTTKIAVIGCSGVKAFKATKAQLLAKALKHCRKTYKNKKSKKRLTCEKQARKKYGPKHKAKKKSSKKKSPNKKK